MQQRIIASLFQMVALSLFTLTAEIGHVIGDLKIFLRRGGVFGYESVVFGVAFGVCCNEKMLPHAENRARVACQTEDVEELYEMINL